MRIYLKMIICSLKERQAYKKEVAFFLISQLLFAVAQIYIWKALFNSSNREITLGFTVSDMITYVIISTSISVFVSNDIIFILNNKIRSGDISLYLIKPISLEMNIVCQNLGVSLYRFIYQLVPLVIICVAFFHINKPSLLNFILFLLSTILSLIISYLITYILGSLAFWYLSVYQLSYILSDLIKLLSGKIIPLTFFPEKIQLLINILPFQYVYFSPLSIFLNKLNNYEIMQSFMMQMIWIVVLYKIKEFINNRAFKKMVIQGG